MNQIKNKDLIKKITILKNPYLILLFLLALLININFIIAQYNSVDNPYSSYNQNPNYYSQYNDPQYNQNNPNNRNYDYNYNRFKSGYYDDLNKNYYDYNYNKDSSSRYDSRYDSRYEGINTNYGSSYNPSRNIQYSDPRYQQGSYGGYGNYNKFGGYSYTSGYGGYGLSGLYGYGSRNGQYGFSPEMCLNRKDFIIHIAPGGCSPAVVRSDLLEEQNVPVFCKVMSFQANPLLSGTRIRSLRIKGQVPKGVSGISYLPSRIALSTGYGRTSGSNYYGNNFVSNPINDNMGYLVVVLSQQFNESSMPDFVEGNITASIDYDSSGVFGVGRTYFYLEQMNEAEWQRDYRENGFWNGRAFIRADSIENKQATISIYRDSNIKESTLTLREGETSQDINLGGFYCAAGMRVKLEDISAPVESALLQINDQQVWVSKGDRIIDDRCRVTNLISIGTGGTVSLNCPRDRFELNLNSGKATFNIDGLSRDIVVGNKIKDNLFLAYLGKDSSGEFAVLIEDSYSNTELEFLDKGASSAIEKAIQKNEDIEKAVKEQYKRNNLDIEKIRVETIRKSSESEFGNVLLTDTLIAQDNTIELDEESRAYYNKAIKYYQELFDLYSHEKVAEGEQPLAAQGLYEAARLSLEFGMNAKANEFFNLLVENYPDSYLTQTALRERSLLFRYDRSKSHKNIEVDGIFYSINLLETKKPARTKASAVFLIDGEERNLAISEFINLKNINMQLLNLDDDRALVGYEFTNNQGRKITGRENLILGAKSQTSINSVNIKLNHINLEKQAKISIIPNAYGTRTEANFNVKIGIEKRAIQLSPEKTKEAIENLNKAIKSWNEINEKLGKVIKIMKGACFATSAILTVKNLFEGATGSSLARNKIMTGTGGWNDKCKELVDQKQYSTVQQCLLAKNNEIETDIKIYSEQIQKTNSIMKEIQNQAGVTRSDILDFQGQTDSKKVEEIFKQKFSDFCKDANGEITLPGAEKEKISVREACNWDTISHEQRRDIMTLYNVKNSGGSDVLNRFIDRELGRTALDAKNLQDSSIARIKSEENSKKYNLGIKPTVPAGDSVTYGDIKIISRSDSNHEVYKNFDAGSRVVRIFVPSKKSIGGSETFTANEDVAGKEIIIPVKEVQGGGGVYAPDTEKDIYFIDGKNLSGEKARRSVYDYMSLSQMNKIKQENLKAYQNKMITDKLKVDYFERAPYRGLPSLIPFDVDEGWYVKMNYVISGFGIPYEESGRVSNYYICNVGPNGLIEFKRGGDDICRYYNGYSRDLSFPGMTASESALLVQKAQRAIEEASRQYGQQRINIGGRSFESGTSFDSGEGQCTDFMSAQDCNIMFNVCDPVICPPSRCDLGGRYRVDNVIQTGVVGSLALCLPNIKEGIAIPICLTGVHAGLDNYISILNSTSACLNESLATGRNIGICDEIKSVYLCDFFWKQATPFLDVLLERTFEVILGQGVRGGGEYLTVKNAWENTRASVDYFKNQYAVNSIKAFYGRSVQNIGGNVVAEVCKNFISSGFSGASRSVFDALIEPDSPEQYSGWFSENLLTTATIPPISHYKVYFHIFAGKDIGAFYSVYLKEVPVTPGIYSTGIFMVDTGYIARGSQVDKARDFTAVSGFKQLCININGREECGFGKVSTSYLINAITDRYAEEQIKTDIISEKECVAGSPSVYSILQPNIQAGVESVINPQLYNQGIVRICATENPGKQTTPSGDYDRTNSTYDKWKQVGYCDDPTIKCWLDTDSVKNVVRDKKIENNILENVNLAHIGANEYFPPEISESILSEAEYFINNLQIDKDSSIENKIYPIVNKLERLSNIGANNVYRAKAIYSLARLHKKIALALLKLPEITINNDETEKGTKLDEPVKEPINKEEISPEKEITDDMLKQDILIKVKNANEAYEFNYRYNGKWVTNNEDFEKDLRYAEGLNKIVGKDYYEEIYVNNKLVENNFDVVVDALRKQ